MARNPEWFERLDAVIEAVGNAAPEWLGRNEVRAAFGCSERDSIRLLHKFGAEKRGDALSLPRRSLLIQLEAIRAGTGYAAFLHQRRGVARELTAARVEAAARQVRVAHPAASESAGLRDLPTTIAWRQGRFEILYEDGPDLLRKIARFLAAAAADREEFYSGTEPSNGRV